MLCEAAFFLACLWQVPRTVMYSRVVCLQISWPCPLAARISLPMDTWTCSNTSHHNNQRARTHTCQVSQSILVSR